MAVVSRASSSAASRTVSAAPLHPGAWLAWLIATSVTAFLTSNPLYLSLAFLSVSGVFLAVPDSPKKRMMLPVVLIGLVFSALSIPLNVLTGSVGPTALASLPEVQFPGWLGGVTFGGSITAEALVTAIGRALTISTLVVAAAAFNASIDHFRLVRLAPRSLAQVMLVLTIAVVVVPQAVAHGRRVVEARRLRGREGRGLRALPALLLPVLGGALERSVQRAESMEARGFGSGVSRSDWRLMLLGVAGVGVGAWGAFTQFYYGGALPIAMIVCGIAIVLLATVRLGGKTTDRLRSDPLSVRDVVVVSVAALSVLIVLALRFVDAGDVRYLAYPELTSPSVSLVGALAFALLLTPALLLGDSSGR